MAPTLELDRALRATLEHGASTRDLEVEIACSDREDRRWAIVNVEPVEFGGRRHAVAAIHDISRRKLAELHQREASIEILRRFL